MQRIFPLHAFFQTNLMRTEEKDIYELIRDGDIKAFNLLFQRLYMQLYIYCRKFIPDPEEAKDILQNVFLHFWERRGELCIDTSLRAYLFRTVHNECLNFIRSTRQTDLLGGEETIALYDCFDRPDETLNVNEMERHLKNSIDSLPEQCRVIFRLSRFDGLSVREIAGKLDLSPRTVETQIYRALKMLKKDMKEYLRLSS